MSSYKERRAEWESKIEDVIIGMVKEKNNEGISIQLDFDNLIKEFNHLFYIIDAAKSGKNVAITMTGIRAVG